MRASQAIERQGRSFKTAKTPGMTTRVKTKPHNDKDVDRETAAPGSVKAYNKTAKPELVALTVADLVAGFGHFRLSEQ